MEPRLLVLSHWPDEPAVRERARLDSLLSQAEEDHADVAGLASIESKRELVQVGLQMLGFHPAVVSAVWKSTSMALGYYPLG